VTDEVHTQDLQAGDPPTGDQHAEERAFLLRSLDDLDAERAAGNIDDETYAELHADYTARAAIAMRDDGSDGAEKVDDPQPSRGRRVVVVGGLVVFALVVAIGLAVTVGARLPGDPVTGRGREQSTGSAADRERALEAAVADRPEDASAQLALARFRLGQQDAAGALEAFQAAAQLAPTNPEPFTYSGWIIRLQGYPDQGLQLLDKALEVDPNYPDAHFFRGFILLRDRLQPERAIPDFQQYLVAAPDSPLADQVRVLLAEAVESGNESPAPGSP
jgi:cytochrome c-type biogenesis protein CcmH/NrfG